MKLNRNDAVLLSCLAFVAVMVGASFAAVPLYRIFCQVTGYGGTPQRADAPSQAVGERVITVRFDSNVDPGLDWQFQPLQREVQVRVGENKLVYFRAKNNADVPVTGQAAFNVTPDIAAPFFDKIECFCFTEQTLAAHQSVDMPVFFFIDPKIVNDGRNDRVKTITLSYTFYPAAGQALAGAGG
ncbi:MAG: cytochrome c oxidase assembly protein [Alphaproteobacteria bacterium]